MCRLNVVATRNDGKVSAAAGERARELEESDGELSLFFFVVVVIT